MKKTMCRTIMFALLFTTTQSLCLSQENVDLDEITFSGKFLKETPIFKIKDINKIYISTPKISEVIAPESILFAPSNSVFDVIDDNVKINDKEYVIIKFWNWRDSNNPKHTAFNANEINDNEFKAQGSIDNDYIKLFLVSKYHIDKAIKYYKKNITITSGVITLPIKLRFDPSSASTNLNLGVTVGAKYRVSHTRPYYVNLLVSLGPSQVTIDQSNSLAVNSSSQTAFTPSIGAMFEFKKIQIACFTGWDILSNNAEVQWKNNSKMWLGFGIGYSIINRAYSLPSDQ